MVLPSSVKILSLPRTVVSHRAGGREKPEEVFGGLRRKLWRWDATQFRDEHAGERCVGGLVALAAKVAGREKGRVGFDENAISGRVAGDILDNRRFRIGHVTGEGKIEARGKRTFGLLLVAGEAVHDARQARGCPVLGDEREQVFPGVGGSELCFGGGDRELGCAAVDGDGFARGGGDLHLRDEGSLLDGNFRVFEVIIVETDLAYSDAAWVGCELG